MDIQLEFVFCEGCSLPVIDWGEYVEDVTINNGIYGSDQIPSGVEHECTEENYTESGVER